jgi:hypothetical protein
MEQLIPTPKPLSSKPKAKPTGTDDPIQLRLPKTNSLKI